MDSRGWIPVSLLASFNRVRQLTSDPQLVREVLALSQIVEMRDDCVRMGGGEWAQFVLADAPVSTVEVTNGEEEDRDHVEEEGEIEDEDEDEDIEIVMDRGVTGQRWMGPPPSSSGACQSVDSYSVSLTEASKIRGGSVKY
jgi:la-related protein 1